MRGIVVEYLSFGSGNQTGYILYAVVVERVVKRQVDVELRSETAVGELEKVAFLALQVGISLTDEHGVLIVEIRIQAPDSGPPDTQIVGQSQVLRLSHLHAEHHGRHDIAEIGTEILTGTYQILHPLYGLFVAQPRLDREVFVLQRRSEERRVGK